MSCLSHDGSSHLRPLVLDDGLVGSRQALPLPRKHAAGSTEVRYRAHELRGFSFGLKKWDLNGTRVIGLEPWRPSALNITVVGSQPTKFGACPRRRVAAGCSHVCPNTTLALAQVFGLRSTAKSFKYLQAKATHDSGLDFQLVFCVKMCGIFLL